MQIKQSNEAMQEYEKCKQFLTEMQKDKLLSATLSQDGGEWCILSGSDMMFDRSGFGKNIHEAMQDYLSIYIKDMTIN
jgi:hypothetical protein